MEAWAAVLVGAVVGGLVGAMAMRVWIGRSTEQDEMPVAPAPLLPEGVASVLSVLRSAALVVGPGDQVVKSSAPAQMLGLVNGPRVAAGELLDLVRRVRLDGQIREEQLTLRRGRGKVVTARVAPLGSQLVLALVEDRTRERRVDEIRRDFVANVSHELKTPVGALNLLAEAVTEASDDPEAVQRFSARMQIESQRLTRLVQQIIELSHLQSDDPLEQVDPVSVDTIAERAIDRVRVDAADKGIGLQFTGMHGCRVMGDLNQLVVALGNIVENAVAYSSPGGHVTVSVRNVESRVEIAITDRGVGIPQAEIERIFERFYRVDPARARATGGTGLGLSIVKHVVATHGGDVRVWSAEGDGSTFTLSLPAYQKVTLHDSGQRLAVQSRPDSETQSALETQPQEAV
jgi:two-component system sensor histidine kinase SenX3